MAHRKPGRATFQWFMARISVPATPFVRFCYAAGFLLLCVGLMLWLGQPVFLALAS